MRGRLLGLVISAILLCQLPLPLRASEIPLGMDGGIYTVPVQINGSVAMQFLVDPGAGVVVIPLSVLRSLIRNGTLTDNDLIGIGTAELADSSLYVTARVRLRELRIGNVAVHDVTAVVSPGLSQPLLGQSFLRRFASVTFDNQRHILILSDSAPVTYPQPPTAAWVAPYPAYPSYPAAPLSGSSSAAPGYYYPGAGR
jgi:clan AA aspartic protease (TIGR02281 family)